MTRIPIGLDIGGEDSASRTGAAARLARAYVAGEDGASAAEYAIMLFVLSGCAVFILHGLGHRTARIFLRTAHAISAH